MSFTSETCAQETHLDVASPYLTGTSQNVSAPANDTSLQRFATTVPFPSLPGAASSSSSQASDGHVDKCQPHQSDSGYASEASTPKKQTSDDTPIRHRIKSLPPRSVIKLRRYNKAIPLATQRRFDDLLDFVCHPLRTFILDARVKYTGVLMRVETLGETEDSAKPWVIVQCDSSMLRKVKQFFEQPQIKSQFRPNTEETNLPSLDVCFCDRPPCLMGAASAPVWRHPAAPSFAQSLCGAAVVYGDANTGQTAVIGGIIEVKHFTGKSNFYAMKVAHLARDKRLDQSQYHEREHQPLTEQDHDKEQVEPKVDALFKLERQDEDYELELEPWGNEAAPPIAGSLSPLLSEGNKDATPVPQASMIGRIQYSSYDEAPNNAKNYDWALIELDQNSLLPKLQGQAGTLSRAIVAARRGISTDSSVRRSVVQWNNLSGIKRGTMSFHTSMVMLSPGTDFIRAHTVVLDSKASKIHLTGGM